MFFAQCSFLPISDSVDLTKNKEEYPFLRLKKDIPLSRLLVFSVINLVILHCVTLLLVGS